MIGLLTRPAGMIGIGVLATFAAYQVGNWIGQSKGRSACELEQMQANEEERLEIRERIQDALDEIGHNPTNDDIDRVLRELTGQ